MKSGLPTHPVSERMAALYHGVLAGWYLIGLWFHVVSTWRHFRERADEALHHLL